MKKIFSQLTVLSLLFTFAASDVFAKGSSHHLKRRIQRGTEDGSLNRRERRDLREDRRDIKEEKHELQNMRERAREDGTISAEERARIQEQRGDVQEDRQELGQDIYRQRHDKQGFDRDDEE